VRFNVPLNTSYGDGLYGSNEPTNGVKTLKENKYHLGSEQALGIWTSWQ